MKRMLALIIVCTLQLSAQQYTIKFATLAPEGSTWITVMREYDQVVRKESGGRLGFKIYAGGVAGDERDVLRKIRLGQFQSAGITGVGIGEIAKSARILDAPFLFKNHAEVDYVVERYDAELRKDFAAGGYVLLGWAEVGFVYVFTNTPVTKVDDIRQVKMWQWEGDPVAEATFKAFGINPIQLSITDVLTSLQTGLINAMYISPYAGVSLQWYTATKCMLDYPLTNSSGAVVLSKRDFDRMSPDLQEILLRNGKQLMRKLTEFSRQDNLKSLDVLKKNKIIFTKPEAKEVPQYEEIGRNARRLMVGKLFSEDLLKRVEQSVADFRAKGGK